MKYLVILGDGMSDYPDENGQTPLTQAVKPTIDGLCASGVSGLCQTIPEGLPPGSDVANLAVMGYDPRGCYTGRSPLEAVSIGVNLDENDVTYRLNLVTLSDAPRFGDKVMLDYSAGEIPTEKSSKIVEKLQKIVPDGLKLYAGVSYRHCLLRKNAASHGAVLTPPHDISGKKIAEYLPEGVFADILLGFMKAANAFLSADPDNGTRANAVWIWGEGTKPRLKKFSDLYGKTGAVISAVDLIKGIGISAGLKSIDVAGATGTLNTNFEGKAAAAVDALKKYDYVYLHIEAPDECGHQGDRPGKIRAVELIDKKIVKPLRAFLKARAEPYRILITPDHATPLALRTHTRDPVPFVLFDSSSAPPLKLSPAPYSEFTAKASGLLVASGEELAAMLFENSEQV
ncbi:MAG: cofactor-independent phosphoglycerate mutase [Clostridiales bacterium]|jgi:2,3-bisphosphoglycerate-independent phosphoglycerate mutase|nr:cofactor-independent phosphoglycerate mutase [Clostridiales bacterium]